MLACVALDLSVYRASPWYRENQSKSRHKLCSSVNVGKRMEQKSFVHRGNLKSFQIRTGESSKNTIMKAPVLYIMHILMAINQNQSALSVNIILVKDIKRMKQIPFHMNSRFSRSIIVTTTTLFQQRT